MKKQISLFLALVLMALSHQAQTITTGTVASSSCAGANVSVPFSITGSFTSGNIFTAQLSDATGSFASPVNIGSLSGVASGSINAMIPQSTVAGTAYRIRVVSILPVITGTQNAAALTINAVAYPNVSISASQNTANVCSGTSITFTATPVNGGTSPIFTWKKNGVTVGTNSATYTNASWANNDTVQCLMSSNIGCALNGVIRSNKKIITIENITPNTWQQKADLGFMQANGPNGYSSAVAFSIGNKGYVGTGLEVNGSSDFWEFDPATNAWTQIANFGGGVRYGAVAFSIGNKGYVGTGYGSFGTKSDFWEYDPATNLWTQKANFGGGARTSAVGFSIGNKGYIGTGLDNNSNRSNDFWEYDPGTNLWTQKANFAGGARDRAVGFSIGAKGYIGVGFLYSYLGDFWEYDPGTNLWTQKANFGGGARIYSVGFSIGEKGYIATGIDAFSTKNDVWEFDPNTNLWTQKANFGGGERREAVGLSIGNKGYIGLGITGNYIRVVQDFWEFDAQSNLWTQKVNYGRANVRAYSIGFNIGNLGYVGLGIGDGYNLKEDFWEYNPALNSWSQKANFTGGARQGAIGFSIGNRGYVGTGFISSGSSSTTSNDFWEYNPSLNTWVQKANFAGGLRARAVAFSIGNKGYVGTGFDNSGQKSDFWEYDPALNIWVQKADFGGGIRWGAFAFSIGNKGYVGTGNTGSTDFNDFWEYDPSLNTWVQKANFGGGVRSYAAAFSIGNKGYVGTGYSSVSFRSTNDFWEYDPASNAWVQKANFGGGVREAAIGFSIANKGYIGLGTANSVLTIDFWEYTPFGAASINTGSISGPFCVGATTAIPFATGCISFSAGNIFTAQLSDASGSFATPVTIGTLTSTGSGSINATIPSNSTSGNGYRIRVIASNPSTIGADNGSNIIIGAPSSSSTSVTVCANQLPYSWNGGSYSSAGTYTFRTSSVAGCDSTATLVLSVNPLPTVNAGTYPALTTASSPVTLSGLPAGGVFSGTGVSSNTFNPAVSGAGTFVITYSYTNPTTGCSNTATTSITVTQFTCNFSVAAAITGNANVCGNMGVGDSATFSISATNASTYAWSVSNATTMGISPVRNGTAVKIKFSSTFTTGTLTVTVTGCDGTIVVKSLALSKTVPGTPAGITGPGGSTAVTYICPYIGGANVTYVATPPATNAAAVIAYRWTLPTGAQLVSVNASDSSSITIKYPVAPTTLTLSVLAVSGCGNSAAKSITLNVTAPAAPLAITGLTDVCAAIGTAAQSTNVVYSIAAVNNAASYLWTVPTGVTLVSGQGTTSVNLAFASSFVSGNITVQSISTCGNSTIKSLTVYKRVAAAPAVVAEEFSGTLVLVAAKNSVCGLSSSVYRIRKVTYATSYLWRMKSGAKALLTNVNPSGVNDTAATVSFLTGFTKDTIQVQALTACSVSTIKETIVSAVYAPPTASPISGSNTPCIGNVITYYAAAPLPTATQSAAALFRWTKPNNTSIVSASADSSTINLSYNTGFTGGTITVKAQSACSITGTASSLLLQYLTPTPTSITSSTGVYNACIGTPITFTAVVPAPTTSQRAAVVYRWTKPNYTTITSATADSSSITLQFNTGYIGGSITVKGQTACGVLGTAKSQALTHTGCPAPTRLPVSGNINEGKQFDVVLFPNPAKTSFQLNCNTTSQEVMTIKVMDAQGRCVNEIKTNAQQTLLFGNELNAGTYLIEVRQGKKRKTVRAVKL